MIYAIKNWEEYQHYKDRNPPWIKLHTNILTSRTWVEADDKQKTLLVVMMLLAARYNNKIPGDPEYIRKVAYLEQKPNLDWLVEVGFCETLDEPTRSVGRWKSPWPSRHVSKELRSQILSRDKNKCVFCGATESLEIDHIIPVSKGGESNPENLQVLCRKCNRTKRTRVANATKRGASATKKPPAAYSETEKRRDRVDRFDVFWKAYPKKVGKGAARRIWERLNPSQQLLEEMLSAISEQRMSDQWKKDKGQFIPNPATWLNQERWQDSTEIDRPPPPVEDPTPKEKRREIIDRNGDTVVMEWKGKFGWQEIERRQAKGDNP